MLKILEKVRPEWALRLGLGLTYLYSGFNLFYHPRNWTGFAPQWFRGSVGRIIPVDIFVRGQGIAEFTIALLFLAWFSGRKGLRIATIFAILEFGAILLFVGVDPITFRDIGLLGGAVALAILEFGEGRK